MMINKRVNEYKVSLKHLKNNKGELLDKEPIEFIFQNHDDIDKILEKLGERKLFPDDGQIKQFVIGLKLFGDIYGEGTPTCSFSTNLENKPLWISNP